MTPLSRQLRAAVVPLVAAALAVTSPGLTAAAAPAEALDVGGLDVGSYRADVVVGAFTVRATDAKPVDVDAHARTSDRGDVYTQRLKLGGTGTAEARSLQVDATAGDQILVHARSGSGTDDRELALYDASWTVVDTAPALADDGSVPVVSETLHVPEDGTYWIASPSSGVNVYYAELDPADDADRVPWDQVAAPAVVSVEADPDDPSRLLVSYTGTVGDDGADLAHADLYDAGGGLADQAFTAAAGPGGTIALTPPASGAYAVEVRLTRAGEEQPLVSERVSAPDFSLPLAAPQVTGALTSSVSGDVGVVTVEWSPTAEAESYSVEVAPGAGDFEQVVDGVAGTSADVPGLAVGQTYRVRVVAHRGADTATSEATEVTVAAQAERWQVANAGTGSGGEVVENADGTLTFDMRDNAGKIADSEDGFWYYYTQIDPDTENFTMSATFHVDDAAAKDNQSGFGIVAVDDFVPGDGAARYFNSAGIQVAKFQTGLDGEVGNRYGTPGGKFVHGYTGAPTESSPDRDMSDSRALDWDYKDGYTEGSNANPPRFETGETYELTLRKSNTGFHAVWHRDGEDLEVIQYDPDMLLVQNPDTYSVGLFAARKIQVTVTDWSFETIRPEDDEPAQEPPVRYVTPTLTSDITSTTPLDRIDVPLVSNVHGQATVYDADGEPVGDPVQLEPGSPGVVPVDGLAEGENTFTARLVPDAEQPQLGEREELSSTDPVDVDLSFTVHSYGRPGQSLWVAPDGSADGDGTRRAPLDLGTAVAYAQPGQQIVLRGGTYTPQHRIVVERGRDGTAKAPITLMSEPGDRAVLDLSESPDGGIVLRADHWHLYDLEITRSQGYQKPLHIQGSHNVIEKIETHHNQDGGLQISGSSAEDPSMWPAHNLVLSSVSHNNTDPTGNDADGFGAKLTVGEGNVFRYCIAHHNIDDGWDLYAKSTTGPIGTVVIEHSVAYANGYLEATGLDAVGEGNGFKLGGESMPGDHLLRNAVSFGNLGNGVTSNSGPDVRVRSVTSVGNGMLPGQRLAANLDLHTNAARTAYEASGFLSWQAGRSDTLGLAQEDSSLLTDPSNYFDGVRAGASPEQVTEDWFTSTDTDGAMPSIAADGSIDMHGLFELTDVAPAATGARLEANPHPTVIRLLPTVTSGDHCARPPRGPGNNNGHGHGKGHDQGKGHDKGQGKGQGKGHGHGHDKGKGNGKGHR